MTFIDVVNQVLIRLRDNKVSSFSNDVYLQTILAHVNDAKYFVESSWDWNVLRKVDDIAFVTNTADLVGSNRAGYRLYNVRTSKGTRLNQITKGEALDYGSEMPTGIPNCYYQAGVNNDTHNQLLGVVPIPKTPEVLSVEASYPDAPLVVETDWLSVPSLPVILYATTFASRERGETGGTSTAEWSGFSKQALSDAIGHDTAWNNQQFIWHEV